MDTYGQTCMHSCICTNIHAYRCMYMLKLFHIMWLQSIYMRIWHLLHFCVFWKLDIFLLGRPLSCTSRLCGYEAARLAARLLLVDGSRWGEMLSSLPSGGPSFFKRFFMLHLYFPGFLSRSQAFAFFLPLSCNLSFQSQYSVINQFAVDANNF